MRSLRRSLDYALATSFGFFILFFFFGGGGGGGGGVRVFRIGDVRDVRD